MNNQPLVSIAVVTYNSSEFVLETLESIKAQTYQDIELIISDDCSTDNTIELCQKWIEENKDRFIRTQIITVDKNTGVSVNLNRAESACQGEWVKPIAGDDLLLPTCIKKYIDYVSRHNDRYFVFGKVKCFDEFGFKDDYLEHFLDYSFFDLSAEKQYERLVYKGNCIPAPSFFYNNLVKREYNIQNDESIPMCEDYPKWINITEKGKKLYLLDDFTIMYRISSNSISNSDSAKFKESQGKAYLKYCFREQKKKDVLQTYYKYFCVKKFLTQKEIYSFFILIISIIDKLLTVFRIKKPIEKRYKSLYRI